MTRRRGWRKTELVGVENRQGTVARRSATTVQPTWLLRAASVRLMKERSRQGTTVRGRTRRRAVSTYSRTAPVVSTTCASANGSTAVRTPAARVAARALRPRSFPGCLALGASPAPLFVGVEPGVDTLDLAAALGFTERRCVIEWAPARSQSSADQLAPLQTDVQRAAAAGPRRRLRPLT